MKIKVLFILCCIVTLISCKKHICTCTEYKGKSSVNQYEKSLTNASTCEELSSIKIQDNDTVQIVCGEENPL